MNEATLPDLLGPELEVVFVGINPSVYSAARGHYFARPQNRFWPAFSRSALSLKARRALGEEALGPGHDRALLAHGFGFTDLVKRPTPQASGLARAEMIRSVAALIEKLERHRPRIACFHGITAFQPVHRVLADPRTKPALGLQATGIGATRLFVIPNPSGANAHTTPAELTRWYDRLLEALEP